MKLTILGSGTSTGVPEIGCTCPVCTSADPRDSRLRASALLHTDDAVILIDCGPDFRTQMLRASVYERIDGVLITHEHYDHVGGLDDLRPFCRFSEIPVYSDAEKKKRLRLLHSYENGRIKRLLQRVERKCYYKNLPKALDTYEPQNGFEQPLVDAMKRGLPFLTPARGIMQYAYDAYYSENPDFHPMYLQQQIRVVYDINDIVSEYLVDYYNSNSRETYDITPVTTCDLSSDTGELFRMDDYPERFFKWADKFINIIC